MIAIKNIYYMLSYAFQSLQVQGFKSIETESFDNTAELCAAILSRGIEMQVKRGLGRTYVRRTEPLSTVRGRMEIAESIKGQTVLKRQIVCAYDDFSVNSTMNRIIKSTVMLLLGANIAKSWKKALRKHLVYFVDMDGIDLRTVDWNMRFDRNHQTYRLLISVCWLVVKGLLQTQSDGTTRLMDFLDEQRMCRLYEKFILEYYRKEHPELRASTAQIPWQLDDGMDDLLPIMQTDILLTRGERVLIIDAKYYAHTTQTQYDIHTLHSGNLYQIFTYVKNKEAQLSGQPHEVSGLLLYAGTDEAIQPNHTYHMSGNRIGVRTLDLSGSFDAIRAQLDGIAEACFA